MKLQGVSIHNVRGAADVEVTLRDYSLLVGPNNSGKSTVVDAIRAFYELDGFKFDPKTDVPHITVEDDESWIELEFLLTPEERDSLPEEYQSDTLKLRLRKYLRTARKSEGAAAAGLIFAYKPDGLMADKSFYAAKNILKGKLGTVVYIPAISRVDDHTKLSGPSALRDLLTGILTAVVKEGHAHEQLEEGVSAFAESVRGEKTSDGRSLAGLESELNSMLASWDTTVRFDFPAPDTAQIIKSMLEPTFVDKSHGGEQPIDSFGSGFQRHLIYSVIQLGARYVGPRADKKDKDFTPSMTLVLFEEPEAFLHPPQQDVLARSLMALAASGQWQILCATHSANFVSRSADDLPATILLRRESGRVQANQIDEESWRQIADANLVISTIAKRYPKMAKRLSEDDCLPEMEAIKHFLWLNSDRSCLFFANHVLLVEGPTEVAFINRLVGEGRIPGADCGLYVLDSLGKYNIHRFMNLLGHLGIRHSVIFDDDDDLDEHAELNQLIEDSRYGGLTLSVKEIAGDIETMLGIPKSVSPHRKPQHVLFEYAKGKIDPSKVEAFCQLVGQSLPPSRKADQMAPDTESPCQ